MPPAALPGAKLLKKFDQNLYFKNKIKKIVTISQVFTSKQNKA